MDGCLRNNEIRVSSITLLTLREQAAPQEVVILFQDKRVAQGLRDWQPTIMATLHGTELEAPLTAFSKFSNSQQLFSFQN